MRRSRIAAALAVAATFVARPVAAEAIRSVYTALDLDKCRHRAGKAEEDYGTWTCRGYAGIRVHVAAGDQRTYISFGRNAEKEPAAEQTLAAFNSEGKVIEWRLAGEGENAKPFATIIRWSTTVGDQDPPVRGQVLVITRLGPGGVCHVGYVDARVNPDANALAQKLADERARAFRCGTDKAMVEGKIGPGFSKPSGD
ncbi:MAG: hypothetical protein AB7O50_00545 [Pseudolabrys sp.]